MPTKKKKRNKTKNSKNKKVSRQTKGRALPKQKKRKLKYSVKNIFLLFILALIILMLGIFISRYFDHDETIINNPTFNRENADEYEFEEPNYQKYISFKSVDEGYDLYKPNGSGYRYGASMIMNDDGSMDLWMVSPGNNSTMWDYIVYRHLSASGRWSNEKIVLMPTPNSKDHFSTCDPGVIHFGDYYYLGYTSTTDRTGFSNNLFVARSKNPDGPFEKWNGQGWGGNPEPIIVYDENDGGWGVGEPSFVIKDDVLYIYYSFNNSKGNYSCLATSDTSENWPSNISEDNNIILSKVSGQDSIDVLYVDEIDSFMAVTSLYKLTESSGVFVYQSDDGVNFTETAIVKEDLLPFLHNIGISKRKDGHVSIDDELFLAYAYARSSKTRWGLWSCHIQNINLLSWKEIIIE